MKMIFGLKDKVGRSITAELTDEGKLSVLIEYRGVMNETDVRDTFQRLGWVLETECTDKLLTLH